MIITEQEGITNKDHLAITIVEKSSLPITLEAAKALIEDHLEYGLEILGDDILIGYALIFNYYGIRSLHGYKLIKGFDVRAFRLIKNFIDDHKIDLITTTVDKTMVRRLGKMLGMKEKLLGGVVCLSR